MKGIEYLFAPFHILYFSGLDTGIHKEDNKIMKKRNHWLALLLTATLSVSLIGCGGKSNTPNSTNQTSAQTSTQAPTTEPEKQIDPLTEAEENMKSVTNMDAQFIMEMDMNMSQGEQQQAIESTTTMDITAFSDPMRLKMEMTIDAGDQGSASQSIYVDTAEDGTSTLYLYDGANWVSQQVSSSDLSDYNFLSDAEGYVDKSMGYQDAGTEQVDGKDAYKYTAVITGDELKQELLSSGALDSLSSLGLDESQLEGMMDDLGEMTVALWIDASTLYPVKYEMDMTQPMDNLMAKVLEAMGDQAAGLSMGYSKMTMVMTFSNFNAATEFSIPEEALAS